MTNAEYIKAMVAALRVNPHAREFYFPSGKGERKVANLRLARELGHGLDGEDGMQSIYSTMFVQFSLDGTGVVVDAAEIVAEIRKAQDGK